VLQELPEKRRQRVAVDIPAPQQRAVAALLEQMREEHLRQDSGRVADPFASRRASNRLLMQAYNETACAKVGQWVGG
jgi:hypothetical protein